MKDAMIIVSFVVVGVAVFWCARRWKQGSVHPSSGTNAVKERKCVEAGTKKVNEKKKTARHEKSFVSAKRYFPGLIHENESVESFRNSNEIKEALCSRTKIKLDRLRDLDKERSNQLHTRKYAPELCIEVGMEESFVRKRFGVIKAFEDEVGIRGKVSTVNQIYSLIEDICMDEEKED